MLQWGRVLLNAERALAESLQEEIEELQWGRVLLNAERTTRPRPTVANLPLQWGRVLLNAERLLSLSATDVRPVASMGPRSVERGKKRLRGIRRELKLASMGPRSVERGKLCPEECQG